MKYTRFVIFATALMLSLAAFMSPTRAARIQVRMDDPPCSACHLDPPQPEQKQYGLCNDPEEPTPCRFSGIR